MYRPPESELSWRFSRSSGPGGQGVNTTDSRVELSFDVARSPSLPAHLRARALARLHPRLVDGVLTVVATEHRSQLRNRDAARERLVALLGGRARAGPAAAAAHPSDGRVATQTARRQGPPRRDQTAAGQAGRVASPGRGPRLGVAGRARGGLPWKDAEDHRAHGRRTSVASPTSRGGAEAVPPVLPSIPLAPEPVKPLAEQSIGNLVKEATAHVSTLVRAEVELARAEVTAEVKKGLQGSIFFIVALAIVLFSLFFLFFTIAEVIAIWLPEWAAFAITFGIMVLAAALFGLLGYLRVRKIRKPERTISSLKESAQVLSHRGHADVPAELNGHGLPR